MKDTNQTPPPQEDLLAALRIDQSYSSEIVGVRKLLQTVPIRKPRNTDFVRVHPEHMLDCLGLEIKSKMEHYFVLPALAPILTEFVEPTRLRLTVTRQGTVFLWPIKLPKDDGRTDRWRTSAAEAASLAETRWTRVSSDIHLGAYQPFVADDDLGDPKWPEEPWSTIVQVALRDSLIDSEQHPVVRDLQGKA
jgi:hypothetical protein